jgi:hypothetical protein
VNSEQHLFGSEHTLRLDFDMAGGSQDVPSRGKKRKSVVAGLSPSEIQVSIGESSTTSGPVFGMSSVLLC